MPTAVPPLPAGIRNESLEVGAAPVIRHFLEKLGLPGLFDRYLPRLRGRRRDVPTPTVLCVLLSNLLLARQPLYGVAAWAAGFVPEHLGLLPEQLALLNDDRCGRALDHFFCADRASLLTAVAVTTIRAFELAVEQMSQDTTTVTFSGEYQDQPAAQKDDRPGNRQPKGTHIGKQNGPTWGQMYTARGQSVGHRCAGPLLSLGRGLVTVGPPSETEAGSAGTQPARDSSADGVPPGASQDGPRPRRWSGGLFSPRHIRGHASENPGGLGAEPPRRHPSGALPLPGSLPFLFLFFIDSRKR